MRAMFHRNAMRGATLPATVLLLIAATLTGLATLRSAASESRLAGTLLANHRAFALAEIGIAAGYRAAIADPARLPTTTDWLLAPREITGMGSVRVLIKPGSIDNACPALAPLPAERRHYEIHATAVTGQGTRATHVQGIYVCREICATADCIAAELPMERSYWQARTGAAQ